MTRPTAASAFHRPLPRRRRCHPRARTYATKCRPSGVGVAVRVVALTAPTSAHPVDRSKRRMRSPALKPSYCEEYHRYRFRSQSVSSFTMASVRVATNPLIQSRQYRGTASDETPLCSTPFDEAGPKTRAKERRDTMGRGRRGRILAYCLIRPGDQLNSRSPCSHPLVSVSASCPESNASAQPLPEAAATQERTLEAVGCSALFGDLRPTRILGLARQLATWEGMAPIVSGPPPCPTGGEQ
jgi:hypothetical protein